MGTLAKKTVDYVRETKTGKVIAATVGLLTIGGGVGLWLWRKNKKKQQEAEEIYKEVVPEEKKEEKKDAEQKQK